MKPNDSLIFLLINDTLCAPNFKTQEEIETYFGEKVTFTLEDYFSDEDYFWDYLKSWKSTHNFKIIKESERCYDRYRGTMEITVIYTFNNKYYSISYYSYIDLEDNINSPSKEVVPIEEKVINYIEKR